MAKQVNFKKIAMLLIAVLFFACSFYSAGAKCSSNSDQTKLSASSASFYGELQMPVSPAVPSATWLYKTNTFQVQSYDGKDTYSPFFNEALKLYTYFSDVNQSFLRRLISVSLHIALRVLRI